MVKGRFSITLDNNGDDVTTARPTQQEGSGLADHYQAPSSSTSPTTPSTSSTSSTTSSTSSTSSTTNAGVHHHDDDDNQSGQNDVNPNQSGSSSIFSWNYLFGPTGNQTLPDSNATDENNNNNNIDTSLDIQGANPDGFPYDIYMNWGVIRMWQFD